MGVLASLFFNQLCALLWLLRRGFRPRDQIPELTLTVPETGGPMVLKIRGKNGQALILENAPVLGQWSEA